MDIAIVTGGSGSIGKKIAHQLCKKGFTVFSTYLNNLPIENSNNKIIYDRTDGRSKEEILKLSKRVLSLGTPKIIVNNAGITFDKLITQSTIEDFENVLNINFRSVLNYSYIFMKPMMENRFGNIINISSVAANKVRYGNSAYGCSKIAIERFSRSLAFELARFNININCVSPGFVKSNMFDKITDEQKKKIIKNIPKRKLLNASNVASLVVDLGLRKIDTTGSIFSISNGEHITV